ncbi:MAG: hypothetical protein MJY56_06950, partial [Bacteroidales bacterium]|nr:hypothetical protein [Bacteroidales bacterium]
MTRYGDVAPSLYTGTMALSVPVYTYKDPDFEIPISLDYSSNGCVPNVRAGVLGPDWSLNAGGVITREIRGFPDEQIFRYSGSAYNEHFNVDPLYYDLTFYGYWSYYVNTVQSSNPRHVAYMSPDNRILLSPPVTLPLDYSGVAETCLLSPGIDFSPRQELYYDMEPDIFHFSFLGYSGMFCLQPDHEIKIFGTNIDASCFSVEVSPDNGQSFSISITTSDGYKFEFEKGDNFVRRDTNTPGISPSSTLSSWILKRIIAPNGRTVNYYYSLQRGIWNIRPNSFYYNQSAQSSMQGWTSSTSDEGTTITVNDQNYLSSIEFDNDFIINFQYGSHTEYAVNNLQYTECKRLESIIMNLGDKVIKTCEMDYDCDPLSPSKATYLTRVSLSGIGDYNFVYYNKEYPRYGTHSVDHWGYFNNKSSGSFLAISYLDSLKNEIFYPYNRREADYNYSKYGILTKVTYPTGGYSKFEYEANDYSKAIVRDRSTAFTPQLRPMNSIIVCGGVRVKSIANYDADNRLLTKSTYSYRMSENNGLSSGILLHYPRYKVDYSTRLQNAIQSSGPLEEHVEIASNNLTRFGQRDMEYSEVLETDLDGNSTRYRFTSSDDWFLMDRIYYGNVSSDRLAEGSSSLTIANSVSTPATSLQYLRGRLLSSLKYNNEGEIISCTENTYSYSPTDSISNLIISPMGLFYQIRDRAVYAGKCNLSSSSEMSLCPSGFIESSHAYEYNNHGQVRSESFVSPDHHDNSKRYYYVTDTLDMQGADTLFFAQMREKNAINRPFRIDKIVDSTKVSSTSISFVQIGGESSHLFRERSIVETDLVNNVVTTTTFQYDTKGHLIEKVVNGTHHTTYIWGYDGLYLVGI